MPVKKLFFVTTVLIFSVLLSACPSALTVPGEKMPATTEDVSQMASGSLKVPVTEYHWSYLYGNTHVQINGEVINETDHALQGVRITATLYDQNGKPIAYGDSFVLPTYLAPKARGTFEVTGLVKRESGITSTRLVTNAQTLNY